MTKPTAAITFLTYEDFEAGDRFYREVLGLSLIEDQGWARVYRIASGAHLGIVQAKRATQKNVGGSGVLVSIVVSEAADVDAWYDRLKSEPSITIDAPPSMVYDIPVYSLFFTDPAGYRIEVQAFTDRQISGRFKAG